MLIEIYGDSPDTRKIKQLGYSPKTPIGRGVYEFVQWYKDYYHVN